MPEIKRTVLQRSPVADLPGYETRLVLLEYPAGAKAPLHTHPVPGLGYVLSGSVRSQFGDGPSEVFSAGESFTDAADIVHTISENTSDTGPLQMLIAYTIKADEPNTQPL